MAGEVSKRPATQRAVTFKHQIDILTCDATDHFGIAFGSGDHRLVEALVYLVEGRRRRAGAPGLDVLVE